MDFSWLRSRVRVLRRKAERRPERLELLFGGFQLEEKSLDLLLQWLLMPNSLVQQALAVRAPLCCWADFRGTGLGDAKLEKLLKCLGSMELKLERLYLAANNITHRSTAVLNDFLHNADGLRTLDISSNSLDDSSSFSLLSSLETSSLVTFFLADNLIRNPPALIDRLRRMHRQVLLDETLEDEAKTTAKRMAVLHLPFLCFQRPVKSELRIATPRSQSPALEAPTKNLSIAGSVEVENAIQSLKSMLPELPSDPKDMDQSSTASFLDKINSFIKTVDVSVPISPAAPAAPVPVMQAATPKPALPASLTMPRHTMPGMPLVPQIAPMPLGRAAIPGVPPMAPPTPVTTPGTTAKATFGSKLLMRPPAPPTPLQHLGPTAPMPTGTNETASPTKAAVMAQYEAALLGDGETAPAAPWKSQRKRSRRTSTKTSENLL